ncbi:MAG: hypothetical protein JW940_17200 [Polyangiaceae bacterium]|nr:hypothetical protein [Polyangiaceae bacterium]
MPFLQWLDAIARDANPDKAGFQAQGAYLLACFLGPMLFGAVVGLMLTGIERVFGIKLSSRGH